MDHPTYTLDQIIQQLTTSWPGGSDINTRTWHAAGHQLEIDGPWGYPTARLGYGDEITYSLGVAPYIPPTAPDSMVAESRASLPGVVNMSAVQIASAQLAFQLWDDLVPFSIVQNSGSNADAADITLNYSSTTPSDRTTTDQFRAQPSNGDEGLGNAYIWLASDWPALSNDGMVNGGYGLVSMEHEIGHALGLSHPGTYNIAVGGFADTFTYATDNRQYTIMSYFGYYNNAPGTASDGWQQNGTQYGSDGGMWRHSSLSADPDGRRHRSDPGPVRG
jgi:serralysin